MRITFHEARLHKFLEDVFGEIERAEKKFPETYGAMCALTEEVGELAKAAMDESYDRVYKEAVQVAAMAARMACVGDPSLDAIRENETRDRASGFVRIPDVKILGPVAGRAAFLT